MRHVYAKLGNHRRAGTVARTRALGLLAPRQASRTATRPGGPKVEVPEPAGQLAQFGDRQRVAAEVCGAAPPCSK
jgi:hypothetical protein